MTQLLEPFQDGNGDEGFIVECPGCKCPHSITTETPTNGPCWTFNGNEERPTFEPSLRVRWTFGPEREPKCCHSFIRDGHWQFLIDCTHELAGQTVPMIPVDK